MVECAVCHSREAEQKHHLRYDPDIIIDVCVPCHILIHNHGVGAAKGHKKTILFEEPIEEETLQLPLYTKVIEKNVEGIDVPIQFIISIDDEVELQRLGCPNHSGVPSWGVWGHPETREIFLRCFRCGWDTKIKRIEGNARE